MRKQRERAGLTSASLARALGWAPSKLSRVEAGLYPVTEGEVSTYLGWCRVPPDEMQYVRELQEAEERDLGFWMGAAATRLVPPWLRSLTYHESTALRSTSYEPEIVPGLLQTEAYATAYMAGFDLPDDELRALVEVRMSRQAMLERSSPGDYIFFIYEQALRLPVGDAAIMRDQLLHLVFAAARSHVSIRVVPTSAGTRSVCRGAFLLLDYGEKDRPLVFLDGWIGGFFVDDSACVAMYKKLVPRLDAISLTEAESQLWLADLASDHRGRGAPDADLEEERL
jgi:transcriptional regulator with XRE-family HTH domain